jgi:predicted PurR-regulated permease PerM
VDDRTKSYIFPLVILITYAWIGCAYIVGSESKRMILHPIVPILLLVLLFTFKKDDTTRHISTVATLLISIWLFTRLKNVFMPFIIGFAMAYIVDVALSEMQRIRIPSRRGSHNLSKGVSVAILVVLAFGFLTFLVLGIMPQLLSQASGMRQGISEFYDSVAGTVKALSDIEEENSPLGDHLPESWRPTARDTIKKVKVYVREKVPALAERASETFVNILGYLSSGLLGTIGQISTLFFIFIVFVYSIQSLQSNMKKILNMFPEDKRQHIFRYASEINKDMRSFLKGQVAVIAIISIISATVYSIIQVPFALLVGFMAGLCNAIPTVGPIIGGAIAIFASILGFVAGERSMTSFFIQLALILASATGIQLIDGSFISPKIMSRALNVHPLVVMFAVLLSASLLGIWGAFLAIPGIIVFKAMIKISRELQIERKARESGLEPGIQ